MGGMTTPAQKPIAEQVLERALALAGDGLCPFCEMKCNGGRELTAVHERGCILAGVASDAPSESAAPNDSIAAVFECGVDPYVEFARIIASKLTREQLIALAEALDEDVHMEFEAAIQAECQKIAPELYGDEPTRS